MDLEEKSSITWKQINWEKKYKSKSCRHQSEFSPQNRRMTLELLSLPSCTITRFPPMETGRPAKWLPIKIPNSLGCSSKTRNIDRFLCLSAHDTGFGGTSARVGDGDGVIIVDHGSRRKESNLMLNEFVEMFKHKTGYEIVEPAHMELAEPSIADAFECCIKQGACRIIVSPFFLFPGRHWHQDIPALTAEAAKGHPGVSYIITAPLGLHQLLVDVVDDRIKHCLRHVAGDVEECSVCARTGKCKLH